MIRKLKSQKGASFIIALIYFLICMMVGASMLTAASADRGRVASTVEGQNNYFAVALAATTFRDKLVKAKFQDSFDYYISGDDTTYESLAIRGRKSDFELDAEGNPICPLPNERFRTVASPDIAENISSPVLDIIGIIGADKYDSDSYDNDVFKPIYDTMAKFARDFFYKQNNIRPDTRLYGGYTSVFDYSFDGEMTLEESGQPISVAFKMVDNEEEYSNQNLYDIIMEFRNIPDEAKSEDAYDNEVFCVSLVLKATEVTESSDGAEEDEPSNVRNITYYVDRYVTNNGVTTLSREPETVTIGSYTLNIQWDESEIIMGTVD